MLANLHGKRDAAISLIGCHGGVDSNSNIEPMILGHHGQGSQFAARWSSDNLIGIGDYHLSVDSDGRLRIKRGRPSSDEDGQPVGA